MTKNNTQQVQEQDKRLGMVFTPYNVRRELNSTPSDERIHV